MLLFLDPGPTAGMQPTQARTEFTQYLRKAFGNEASVFLSGMRLVVVRNGMQPGFCK